MRRYRLVICLAVLAAALCAVPGVSHVWRASAAEMCGACRRPLHDRMRTAALVEGKSEVFCCPACALTAHRQSRRRVQVTELTDYDTDRTLQPATAWVVRDSDVNLCMREHMKVDADKHVHGAQFDRCSPSILAFGNRQAARKFASEHGGSVMRFGELAASFAQ